MAIARSTPVLAAAGLLVIAIAIGLTWWVLSGTSGSAAPPALQTPEAMRTTPTPIPVVVLPPPDAREHAATVELTRMLELPDRTLVPALNNTVGAPPLAVAWQGPWSPIDHVERSDQGVDWYVHQDGTYSTTEMKYRPDLGRMDAMTRIGKPGGKPPEVKPVH